MARWQWAFWLTISTLSLLGCGWLAFRVYGLDFGHLWMGIVDSAAIVIPAMFLMVVNGMMWSSFFSERKERIKDSQ